MNEAAPTNPDGAEPAVRCEYTVTPADFRASLKLYRRASRKDAVGYWASVWAAPIFFLGLAAYLLVDLWERASSASLGDLLFYSLALGLGFALPARYRIGVRRAYAQRNILAQGRPIFCEYDRTRIRFVVPGGTEIAYAWKNFTHFGDGETVAVFMIADAAFHTVPKRALDAAGWDQVRALIAPYAKVV